MTAHLYVQMSPYALAYVQDLILQHTCTGSELSPQTAQALKSRDSYPSPIYPMAVDMSLLQSKGEAVEFVAIAKEIITTCFNDQHKTWESKELVRSPFIEANPDGMPLRIHDFTFLSTIGKV
jgi:hypothetical protein